MNDIIKESMIANAIKCNYDESFETILNKLKKPELKAIVDAHGLKGCSSLAKGGLIERIKSTLADSVSPTVRYSGQERPMKSPSTKSVIVVSDTSSAVTVYISRCFPIVMWLM